MADLRGVVSPGFLGEPLLDVVVAVEVCRRPPLHGLAIDIGRIRVEALSHADTFDKSADLLVSFLLGQALVHGVKLDQRHIAGVSGLQLDLESRTLVLG